MPAMRGTSALTTPRDDLMEGFEEFNTDEGWYIGEQVFPLSPTDIRKGKFSAIPREESALIDDDLRRKPGGGFQRMTLSTEEKDFHCRTRGLEVSLDDDEVADLAASYNLPVDRIAGDLCWNRVRRGYEKRIADAVMDPVTNFTAGQGNYTDVSGTNPWATKTSDHAKTVRDALLAGSAKIGMALDSAVMSEKQWLNLIGSDQFVGRLQYLKLATFQEIANFIAPALGLKNIFVGKTVYNTVAQGGTFSGSRIWSDTYVNVFKLGRLGLTRTWRKRTGGKLLVMEQYREDATSSDVIRTRQCTDEMTLDVLAGHLLKVA